MVLYHSKFQGFPLLCHEPWKLVRHALPSTLMSKGCQYKQFVCMAITLSYEVSEWIVNAKVLILLT